MLKVVNQCVCVCAVHSYDKVDMISNSPLPQVTFKDRQRFNAFCSHVTRHTQTSVSSQCSGETVKREGKRVWQSVDFAPRHHRLVRLDSPKFNFSRHRCIHNRAESAKRESKNRAKLEMTTRKRERDKLNGMDKSIDSNEFRASFRPLGPRDEDVSRAKTWRDYTTYPYINPRPFDHRGVCVSSTDKSVL